MVAPLTLKAGRFYVSPNSGPSVFAGKKCHPDYFVASWQNDTLHEAAGINANKLGYTNAFILAPNYQAGKDSLAGFKRYFKGEIVGEVYTKLGQTDYAAEIAKIGNSGITYRQCLFAINVKKTKTTENHIKRNLSSVFLLHANRPKPIKPAMYKKSEIGWTLL